jgi:hypothetical protein
MTMQIRDKFGNEQPLTWLYEQFGPLEICTEAGEDPPFHVAVLQEVDDLPLQRAQPEAPASIGVLVLDGDGQPIGGIRVVFWWPDAPPLPGSGHHNAGVAGVTDERGRTSFAMGPGAYYDPHTVRGPHDLWIHDPGASERVAGLGMIQGTNHRHLDVTFQLQPPDPPSPPPSPPPDLGEVIAKLWVAHDAIGKALQLLGSGSLIPALHSGRDLRLSQDLGSGQASEWHRGRVWPV